MTGMIINPGSGDIRSYGHSTLANAWKNIRQFRRDIGAKDVHIVRIRDEDDDGRYLFVLSRTVEGRKRPIHCQVMMPGLTMTAVRFRENQEIDAWNFPRLLISKWGSSWLWPFAIDDARSELKLEES